MVAAPAQQRAPSALARLLPLAAAAAAALLLLAAAAARAPGAALAAASIAPQLCVGSPALTRQQCEVRRLQCARIGVTMRWVGLGCPTPKGTPKAGDGGCQCVSSNTTPYCGWTCKERCTAPCKWTGFSCGNADGTPYATCGKSTCQLQLSPAACANPTVIPCKGTDACPGVKTSACGPLLTGENRCVDYSSFPSVPCTSDAECAAGQRCFDAQKVARLCGVVSPFPVGACANLCNP